MDFAPKADHFSVVPTANIESQSLLLQHAHHHDPVQVPTTHMSLSTLSQTMPQPPVVLPMFNCASQQQSLQHAAAAHHQQHSRHPFHHASLSHHQQQHGHHGVPLDGSAGVLHPSTAVKGAGGALHASSSAAAAVAYFNSLLNNSVVDKSDSDMTSYGAMDSLGAHHDNTIESQLG
eukprot:Lankesteria_metandrocarpae@DN9075_c0_g1_i1.p1